MNVVKLRNNLTETLNRVADDGETHRLWRDGARGRPPWYRWKTSSGSRKMEDKADVRAAQQLKEKGIVPFEQIKERLGMK